MKFAALSFLLTLEACPGALGACVFGVPDPRWGEVVAAGLRTRAEADETLLASVARVAREQLAPFRRPKFYVCVRQFEHGKNGKLDRAATIRAFARGARSRTPSGPERMRA